MMAPQLTKGPTLVYIVGLQALGIYVHVPFCRRRCEYCAFATWSDRHHLWGRYVAACRRQVEELTRWGRGPVTSVFFGGGTPSLLPAELLLEILGGIVATVGVGPGAEVTVECNPETVTAELLGAYRSGGVTRLSFGAQSMVPHVLASLGREHNPASVVHAARLAGEAGFGDAFNVDLIFGSAAESVQDWEASLVGVLSLDPPPRHVSAYALTVEPGTPLAAQPGRHPNDDDQARKYTLAEEVLTAAGLQWYEISNWARPGAECAHNLLYWSQGEYLGVGCAAHSHLSVSSSTSRRWWNVRTPERFCRLVEEGRPVETAGETLGPSERAWEALMLSLRTRQGVPATALPDEVYELGLAELRAEPGSRPRAVLTPRGRLLANEVSLRVLVPG
jgi:putative oxygen-independent coproporphyrinogen III oxidase